MKKLVILFSVLLIAVSAVSAVTADSVQKSITVDGNTGDWQGISSYSINEVNTLLAVPPSSSDLSGSFKTAWDSEYLYFLVEVTDDSYEVTGSSFFETHDSVEIMLDGGNEKSTSYDNNDYKFFVKADGERRIYDGTMNTVSGDELIASATQTSDGYVIEAGVKWNFLGGSSPADGVIYGFDLAVNDMDGGSQEHQIMWRYAEDHSSDTSNWHSLQLSGSSSTSSSYTFSPSNLDFTSSNTNTLGVSVSDTVIYRYGYYSTDGGKDWTQFEMTADASSGDWMLSSASTSISLNLANVNDSGSEMVAFYACSWSSGWDCHGDNWQIREFQVTLPEASSGPVCDNGILETGEECDGTNFGGETCQTQGFDDGSLSCTSSCTIDTSGCFDNTAVCGDGVIEGSEECEPGNLNGATCISQGYDSGTLSCTNCQYDASQCEFAAGTPVLYTQGPWDISENGASLRADIYDMGSDTTVDVWFEWRRVGDSSWTTTPEETIDDGRVTPRPVTGLSPNTEYEYRSFARNSEGTVNGDVESFVTLKEVTSGSVAGDHAALMDFYAATNGDSWTNNDGWGGSSDTMGSWYGVTTYSSGPDAGRVKEIRLKNNNLVGQFPSSFGDLTKLTHLRVKGNSLTGPVDTFLCDLESAEWLSFSSFTTVNGQNDREIYDYVRFNHEGKNGDGMNGFTGSLPTCIEDMTGLRMLEIAASHLTGQLPPRLPPNINALFIQSNDMSGPLPPAWGDASSLTHLYINQNFRDAKYTGQLPDEWNGMKELRWFTYKGNEISGEIPVYDNWYDIRLFAGGTVVGYDGEFPFWLMTNPNKHRSLHTLELGTGLTGQLPEQVSPYFDPSTFSIMNNDLTGPIPQWFEDQFKGIVQILWSGNSFSGHFPDVSDFSDLRFIEVAGNNFSGPLPEVDPNNPTLNIVSFHNNNFSGEIPSSWGQLADGMFRRGMRIPGNNIEGKIPRRLGEVVEARFVVENNKFVFADLIEVVDMMFSNPDFEDKRGINFAPQKPFGWAETVTLSPGQTFTYDFSDKSHPDDTYQWTKDGVDLPGQTSAVLTISDVDASDEGDYRLEIDNPFGDVEETNVDHHSLGTLVSEPITLEVK